MCMDQYMCIYIYTCVCFCIYLYYIYIYLYILYLSRIIVYVFSARLGPSFRKALQVATHFKTDGRHLHGSQKEDRGWACVNWVLWIKVTKHQERIIYTVGSCIWNLASNKFAFNTKDFIAAELSRPWLRLYLPSHAICAFPQFIQVTGFRSL